MCIISKGEYTSIWIVDTTFCLNLLDDSPIPSVYYNMFNCNYEINFLDFYSVMPMFCNVHYIEMHN